MDIEVAASHECTDAEIEHVRRECERRGADSAQCWISEGMLCATYRVPLGPLVPFERIRRITGYLVGTTDRFNDAKRAEEQDRVKHGVPV